MEHFYIITLIVVFAGGMAYLIEELIKRNLKR